MALRLPLCFVSFHPLPSPQLSTPFHFISFCFGSLRLSICAWPPDWQAGAWRRKIGACKSIAQLRPPTGRPIASGSGGERGALPASQSGGPPSASCGPGSGSGSGSDSDSDSRSRPPGRLRVGASRRARRAARLASGASRRSRPSGSGGGGGGSLSAGSARSNLFGRRSAPPSVRPELSLILPPAGPHARARPAQAAAHEFRAPPAASATSAAAAAVMARQGAPPRLAGELICIRRAAARTGEWRPPRRAGVFGDTCAPNGGAGNQLAGSWARRTAYLRSFSLIAPARPRLRPPPAPPSLGEQAKLGGEAPKAA